MWADRTPAEDLAPVVAEVRELLPPLPRGEADGVVAGPPSASPEDLVAGLAERPGTVWLDDAPGGRHLVAARPLLEIVADAGGCRVGGPGGDLRLEVSPWDALDALLQALRDRGSGRLFGYLGYELAGGLEALPEPPPDDLGLPVLWLGLHDAWQRPAERRRRVGDRPVDVGARTAPAAGPVPTLRSRPDEAEFVAAVGRIVERVHAGELFQTNLCRRLEAPLSAASAWPLYRALRRASPASRGAYLRLDGGRAVLSVSPESYLRVRGRRVVSEPIKGTRRRLGDPAADRRARRELLASDKDGAELAMIVDLVRNDLGRVCRPGSVRVEGFRELMELPGVFHTRARVAGRLRAGADAVDLLRASFPPGSITGAPKIQAMRVAAGEERRARGPAMGAIGWIDADGDLDLSVAIRTAAVGNGRVAYHAGCGIVADSDPEAELQESAVKARAFVEAVRGLAG